MVHKRGVRHVLMSAGIALLILAVVDVGLLRWGFYDYFVDLNSSVGGAVQAIHASRSDTEEIVAVVGDSRTAAGFEERTLDQYMARHGLALRGLNLGIPGSSLRVWALLLERIDPRCDRFRFVVVPLGQFVGRHQEIADPAARLEDLSFLGPILGLGQATDLANSYPDFAGRQAAWLGSIFKSFAYRYDIRAALADPISRTGGRWQLMHHHESSLGNAGRLEDIAGLRVEDGQVVGFPPTIPAYRRHDLQRFLFPDQSPLHATDHEQNHLRYRSEWLGRICDRYADTGTRVVIVRLPLTALREPDGTSSALGPVLDRLEKLPNVHVIPFSKTADLQSPEFFCDTTHLNQKGRRLWTQRLAEFVAELPK